MRNLISYDSESTISVDLSLLASCQIGVARAAPGWIISKLELEAWKSEHSKFQREYDDLSLMQIVDGIELISQRKLINLTPNELLVEKNKVQLLDS